jgi:magnesium-transporting ATPase (P-type)
METKNLMFNSTQIVEGKGVGMVIRTGIIVFPSFIQSVSLILTLEGDHTLIGMIAGLVAHSKKKKSTLKVGIYSFFEE